MPDRTSASATSCAAAAGVAITPISNAPWAASAGSRETSSTVNGPTRLPTRAGSRSNTATTSNPCSPNPR